VTATGAIVGALCAVSEPVALADLAGAAGVGRQAAERVVDELEQLGLVSIASDGISVPSNQALIDATARVGAASTEHVAVLDSRVDFVRHYAESGHCRRAELLAYFGETYPPPCGNCDNDAQPGPAPVVVHPVVAHPVVVPSGAVAIRSGQAVIHSLWGSGTVLSVDEHELVVAFDSVGYRHLTPAVLTSGLLRPIRDAHTPP
jgi:ATP-dependent DNA helicase RecQ